MHGYQRSFIRTRNTLHRIKSERSCIEQTREGTTRNFPSTRRGRRKARTPKSVSEVRLKSQEVHKRTSRPNHPKISPSNPYAIVSLKDKRFQHASLKQIYSKWSSLQNRKVYTKAGENGIIHNYVDEASFPEIKPPMITQAVDKWGPHVLIAGSESVTPIGVFTQISTDESPTDVGDSLYFLPIAPCFLSGTRFRLLCENYERWLPVEIQIRYVPLGSSLASGAIVLVPLMDPDTQLTISDNAEQTVARAMDYQNAITFNVYNYAVLHVPRLPEDEEPYYIIPGHSARFEVPYAIQAIANTSFPPLNEETFRDIGWLKIDYKVKLYDPRLPELSVDNDSYSVNWEGQLYSNIIDDDFYQAHWPVVFMPASLLITAAPTEDKVYVVTITESIILGVQPNILTVFTHTHPAFELKKGVVLFARSYFEEGFSTGSQGTRVRMHTNLDALYNNDEGLLFLSSQLPTETFSSGKISVNVYDVDHTL